MPLAETSLTASSCSKTSRRLMTSYVSYCHDDGADIALGKTIATNRDVGEPSAGATLIGEPRLGGLHNRYRRAVKDAA